MEGGREQVEGGREDAVREGGSGGREGDLRKERMHGRSEGKRGGRKRARSNGARERSKGGAIKGGREGGKLQGRYPDADTGQYTVYSARNNTQRDPCLCDFGITNTKL